MSAETLATIVDSSKKSLRVLLLQHTLLTSDQLQMQVGRLDRLQTIDLSYNKAVDDALLEKLSAINSLQRVSVRYCLDITSKGL